MTTGPKPKPYELKAAEGFRGHRNHEPGIGTTDGPLKPPFKLEGVARKEWRRVVGLAFWLGSSDSMALADRCLCFQRLHEAETDISKRGIRIRTRNGMVKNPSLQIAREYRASLQRYDELLGLTPSSRTRLSGGGSSASAGNGNSTRGPVDAMEAALCGQLPN